MIFQLPSRQDLVEHIVAHYTIVINLGLYARYIIQGTQSLLKHLVVMSVTEIPRLVVVITRLVMNLVSVKTMIGWWSHLTHITQFGEEVL